jgi:hypothetical protein
LLDTPELSLSMSLLGIGGDNSPLTRCNAQKHSLDTPFCLFFFFEVATTNNISQHIFRVSKVFSCPFPLHDNASC